MQTPASDDPPIRTRPNASRQPAGNRAELQRKGFAAPSDPSDGRAIASFAVVLGSLVLLYAVVLATNRLELHPDEAQYVVWSRDPAWGYYSKPPMIAWSIAAMRTLCGEGESCVRLTGTVLQASAALLVAYAGTLLFGAAVGALSGLVYATLPMTVFSSLFVTTDGPLCLFAAAALVFAVRALRGDRWADWLGFGASVGFGLMSKYSMGVLVIAWLAYLVASPRTRGRLFSNKHIAAGLLALAIFAPNLAWNAAHAFPTLRHTAEISQVARPSFALRELGFFLLSQIGVLGPLLALVLARGVIAFPRRLGQDGYRLPAMLFLVPLALFTALSLVSRANANWTAFALVPAAVLAAAMASADRRERLLRAAVVVNLVIALVFAFLPHVLHASGVTLEGRLNPLYRITGWRSLGAEVRERLQSSPDRLLMTDERLVAAELLYYVHPRGLVMWNPTSAITDHFRLMNDIAARPGADVLFVSRSTDPASVTPSFAAVEELAPIVIDMGGRTPVTFRVYRAAGFKGYRRS